jgi:hypothetical protein
MLREMHHREPMLLQSELVRGIIHKDRMPLRSEQTQEIVCKANMQLQLDMGQHKAVSIHEPFLSMRLVLN